MASARLLHRPDWELGASLAMARSPETQVRRGMGPVLVVEFPNAGIGFAPAAFDGGHGSLRRFPVLSVETVKG